MLAVCNPFPSTNILNKRPLKPITEPLDSTECNQIGHLKQCLLALVSLQKSKSIEILASMSASAYISTWRSRLFKMLHSPSTFVREGSLAQWWNLTDSRRKSREATRKELQETTELSNRGISGGQLCFFFFFTVNQTISTSDVFGNLWTLIVHTSYEALCIIRFHWLVTPVSFGHFLEEI